MPAKVPHWDPARVKKLVAAGQFFIQKTRALMFIGGTIQEARQAAQEVIADLNIRSFAHTVALQGDTADVYAVRFRGAGWYLKFCIDEERPAVSVISFHPLEYPMNTNAGEVKP